jgi:putative transposase
LNNLARRASDTAGVVPRLVSGRTVKSSNQCYTKRRAQGQRHLGTAGEAFTSRRLQRLTIRRTRRSDPYLPTASRRLIDLLVAEGIGTLCIGKNPLWKQEVSLGRRNNQTVVAVPHARFIAMLAYKAELVGIRVQITAESSTSTASFLDADPLPAFGSAEALTFSGRRVKRGRYRAADGRRLNADANGAYTILRKALPDAFRGKGIADAAVHPVRLAV